MRAALLGAFAAFLLLAIPRPGHGAAVYIDSTRSVYHYDIMGSSGGYVYAEPPGQNPDEWLYICGDGDCGYWGYQDSRIFAGNPYTSTFAPSGFGAIGIVDDGPPESPGSPRDGISYYRAVFELDSAMAYDLQVEVEGLCRQGGGSSVTSKRS